MTKTTTNRELQKLAKEVALLILDISYRAKTGHVGSALSISDLLTVLYFRTLKLTRRSVEASDRDRFILSKGHAAAALYAVLYQKGILSKRELLSFGQDEDGLCEHPERKTAGVEMTAGSLGHGLAFGVGQALGLRQAYAEGKLKRLPCVFVLISDGECGEGSVWEAAILAARLKLDNLTVILDYDKWQCFGRVSEVTHLEPLAAKWRAFGWTQTSIDGHDIGAITKGLDRVPLEQGKPTIIIANTISGHGIPLIQDQLIGHYKVFSPQEYRSARKELARL